MGLAFALVLKAGDLARAAADAVAAARKPPPETVQAYAVIGDLLRGYHKGRASGIELKGTTALMRDAMRRGAELVGAEPPEFE
jgi:hypothetical protein